MVDLRSDGFECPIFLHPEGAPKNRDVLAAQP
jgi:hypothetical protein